MLNYTHKYDKLVVLCDVLGLSKNKKEKKMKTATNLLAILTGKVALSKTCFSAFAESTIHNV